MAGSNQQRSDTHQYPPPPPGPPPSLKQKLQQSNPPEAQTIPSHKIKNLATITPLPPPSAPLPPTTTVETELTTIEAQRNTPPQIAPTTTSTNFTTPPTASSFFQPMTASTHQYTARRPSTTHQPTMAQQQAVPSSTAPTQAFTSTPPVTGATYVQSYPYATPA